MTGEQIMVGAGLVLAGIVVEQARLVPRVRVGAWTALSAILVAYVVLRVVPHIVPR